MIDLDHAMNLCERIHCALALDEAGYGFTPDASDVAELLGEYENLVRAGSTPAASPSTGEPSSGTIPWKDSARQFPLYELAPDFTLIDRDPQADERLKLYRDIFAEITAKAVAVCDPTSNDPERVRHYEIPVGPLHRAAGKLGFQLFDGENLLRKAVEEINRLKSSPSTGEDVRGALTQINAVNALADTAEADVDFLLSELGFGPASLVHRKVVKSFRDQIIRVAALATPPVDVRAKEILAAELRGSTAEFLGWLTGLTPPSDKESVPPEMRGAFEKMVERLTDAAQRYASALTAPPVDVRAAVIAECAEVAEMFGVGRQRFTYGGSDIAKAIHALATPATKT